jgi:DNA topoisomerase-1
LTKNRYFQGDGSPMKVLLIVESPTKQKAFEKYVSELPDQYTIASSKGHIRDLAITGKQGFGVDIDACFAPTYKVIKGKEKLVDDLKKQAKKADKVILATDPDREGESIAWHLYDALGVGEKPVERIEFYEITKERILEAISAPRAVNMDMVQSQEARRILDRIVGFMLSKILSKRVYAPAGGRVQSVALRFVIERELEVTAFVPQTYYTLTTSLDLPEKPLLIEPLTYQGKTLKNVDDKTDAKGYRKIVAIPDEATADKILAALPQTVTLVNVKKTQKKREPKAAFRTSTLQQDASSSLNFKPRKTQSVAQSLYEGVNINGEVVGLITYMRTDSDRLSDAFVAEAQARIRSQYGEAYVRSSFQSKTKVLQSQDAHEAIRPTSLSRHPDQLRSILTNDQFKLYQLIYQRAVGSLMTAMQYEVTTYEFEGGDFTFKTSGSVITFPGYKVLLSTGEEEEENILPALMLNQQYALTAKDKKRQVTSGPTRFSEAKLIQEMEYQGIGRPSTYAATLDRLREHHYIAVKGNMIYPHPEAKAAIAYLKSFFSTIVDPTYTSSMELKLDEVKDGETSRCDLLKDFYQSFLSHYEQAGQLSKDDPAMQFYGKCPKEGCEGVIVPRRSKFGVFLGCSNYPTCSHNDNEVPLPWQDGTAEDGKDDGEAEVVVKRVKPVAEDAGKPCPQCGKPLLKRFANKTKRPFLGCSGFPKCRYLENIETKN